MEGKQPGRPQVTPHDGEDVRWRDPEDRAANHPHEIREKSMDKTIADSFPTSDPPSSIPDPGQTSRAEANTSIEDALLANLPPGSWAAISLQERRVVAVGSTREEAIQNAAGYQQPQLSVVRVPQDPDAPEQAA
ncbi:MAG TPA: hypothetical protein VFI95_07870 [Terriglobales bacterium]|nr:hypothetical protein [Terriglobales bacterium]